MHSSVLFNKLVGAFLLPPLNLVILCAIGLLLRRCHPRAGLVIGFGALALLVALSTPAGSSLLQGPLERMSVPLADPVAEGAQAIVVLGGGRIRNAPEYGGRDVPKLVALQRVHYAAWLQRKTGLPVLVSGGAPDGAAESEADLMAATLAEGYGVPVRWTETRSNNTVQNARYTAQILIPAGARRILLVTDATHMPRARRVFEQAGFEVVAAPTLFHTRGPLSVDDFIPTGEGLRRSHYALHEWIGLLWYRLRHGA